jgi:hypothetical protein
MKTLVMSLILVNFSLQAHAGHEEGTVDLSSVKSADIVDYYERTDWTKDSFVVGNQGNNVLAVMEVVFGKKSPDRRPVPDSQRAQGSENADK